MSPYQAATTALCDYYEGKIVDGELRIPYQSFADVISSALPGIDWQTRGQLGSFYIIDETTGTVLLKLARKDYRFFDLCIEICVCNLDTNSNLPGSLSYFAIEVLKQQLKRPTKRGVERKKTWLLDAILHTHVHHIADTFYLPVTRNDVSTHHSACDAVVEALAICGSEVSYSRIKNLVIHPDKEEFRNELELIRKIRNELIGQNRDKGWTIAETSRLLSAFLC